MHQYNFILKLIPPWHGNIFWVISNVKFCQDLFMYSLVYIQFSWIFFSRTLVSFNYQLATTQKSHERRTLTEEFPRSDWPVACLCKTAFIINCHKGTQPTVGGTIPWAGEPELKAVFPHGFCGCEWLPWSQIKLCGLTSRSPDKHLVEFLPWNSSMMNCNL